MIVHDMAQRSPEWFAARLGRLTGSRASDMCATIKSGEAAARRDLRVQLVCERLTGRGAEDDYTNAAMQRGVDLEPAARMAYELLTGSVVQEVGFVAHETLLAGCSPDGYVGSVSETLVSIKCPKSATHLGYLRADVMPMAYGPQMLHELWMTGAAHYDFLSFDDRLGPGLQTFYVRVNRCDVEDQILAYEQRARAFLLEVDRELEDVLAIGRRRLEVA